MTGITQTSQRPGHPARPLHGRRTYGDEEREIQGILDAAQIEREVEVFWGAAQPGANRGTHPLPARYAQGQVDNRPVGREYQETN